MATALHDETSVEMAGFMLVAACKALQQPHFPNRGERGRHQQRRAARRDVAAPSRLTDLVTLSPSTPGRAAPLFLQQPPLPAPRARWKHW